MAVYTAKGLYTGIVPKLRDNHFVLISRPVGTTHIFCHRHAFGINQLLIGIHIWRLNEKPFLSFRHAPARRQARRLRRTTLRRGIPQMTMLDTFRSDAIYIYGSMSNSVGNFKLSKPICHFPTGVPVEK